MNVNKLRGIMAERRCTQSELAQVIGVSSKTFYNKMQRGVFGTDEVEKMIKHLAIGGDLLLGTQFYVSAGYNFRRSSEMKINDSEGDSNHGAGVSLGGGIQLQRFKLNVGYAKYHVSASSLLINVTYSL